MKLLSLTLFLILLKQNPLAQLNSLRMQSGLVHCFFDGTPLINGYPKNYQESQLLYKSFGIEYQRILKNQIRLQADLSYFVHSYELLDRTILINGVPDSIFNEIQRVFADLQFSFLKNKSLNKTLAFQYGVGPALRIGSYLYRSDDAVEVPNTNYPGMSCFDIGMNTKAELAYTPVKWFSLFSQVNLAGMLFRVGSPFGPTPSPIKLSTKPLQMNFPSRFDLSFRVGVGFNF
jgi:hypothetical protein